MRKQLNRLACALMALLLTLSALAPTASAQETAEDPFFGNIRVQGAGSSSIGTYQAARDCNDVVYIEAWDFAAAVGATASNYSTRSSFRYDMGPWRLLVDAESETAEVYFDPDDEVLGFPFYGEFHLTDCLYREEKEQWYLPFEQLLYLSHAQWMCDSMTVFVYRPETLLEILPDMESVMDANPTYADVMGDGAWEQVGNQFKYGFLAALDDIDMTFIGDSILTSFGVKDATTYEDNVMNAALLLLRGDSPETRDGDFATEAFQGLSEFISGASTALDLGSKEAAFNVVTTIFDLPLTKAEFAGLSDKVGVGANVVKYALGVGQALWAREYMSESFGKRLQFLQEVAGSDTESSFYRRLKKSAKDTYSLYYGDVCNAYTQGITLNDVFATVDGVFNIAGVDLGANDLAITPLRWANLAVTIFDTGVEVMKVNFPSMQKALDEAEDIHMALDLVKIKEVMRQPYAQGLDLIRTSGSGIVQEKLDDLRLSAQIMQCAAMHARDILTDLGNMAGAGQPEVDMLQRLANSEKHDKLLTLSTSFADLNCMEEGCVRMEIPPEYVFGLPVIDFDYEAGMQAVEVTPLGEDMELPEGDKLFITTDGGDYGIISTITLEHQRYGSFTYESQLGPWVGNIMGVDMGDGVYTFVLVTYAAGTIGGCEIVVLRPVNDQLQPVKTFDLRTRSDDIYVEGSFSSPATLTVTIHPTMTKVKGAVSIPMQERIGTSIHENGTGTMFYELNDRGCYDLIFCTIERNLYNIDTVGSSRTRYVLEDGQLVMKEQTYNFY